MDYASSNKVNAIVERAFGLEPGSLSDYQSSFGIHQEYERFSKNKMMQDYRRLVALSVDAVEYVDQICKHTPALSRTYIDYDPVYQGGFGIRKKILHSVVSAIYFGNTYV